MNSFFFQQFSLTEGPVPPGAGADLSFGIDHPLPGHIGPPAQGGHGVPDHSSRAPVHDPGDLAVGGNFATWDLPYYIMNPLMNGILPGIFSSDRGSPEGQVGSLIQKGPFAVLQV